MTHLKLNNLVKKYGKTTVVKNINLIIEDKEFVVLVGPSGCGKTTILRMIAGLEEITEGTIEIGDKIVNDIAPKDRDIAMVFQNYALYPHVSVYDNMTFALQLRKMSKTDIDKRVKNIASILNLDQFLNRKPTELSGGQRQRVAIGRAMVREPQVFLMDEPLSNLDAKLRVQMRAEISRMYNRLKTTTIYVTHDQVEAMTLATRIVVMNDGEIKQVDTPRNVYKKPANKFVASFMGSPSMNFFEGDLIKENDKILFKISNTKLEVDLAHNQLLKDYNNTKVTFGIRPEDLVLLFNSNDESENIKGVVDVVELLGNEQIVHVKIDIKDNLDTVVVIIEPTIILEPGDNVYLKPIMKNAHYFSLSPDSFEESLLK